MPSSVISGKRACASFGDSVSSAKPKLRAVVAIRFSSLQRSFEEASRRLPTGFHSTAWPVSASIFA